MTAWAISLFEGENTNSSLSEMSRNVTGHGRIHRVLRVAAVVSVACVAVLSAPAPSLAEESFPALGEVDDLAAGGGYLVWERSSPSGQRLTGRWGGITRDLRLSPAANYAGTDVGRDARGRLVAVYSRCRRARYSCDIYLYRFSSERETRVKGVAKRGCDEFGPSISRGIIVFGRGSRHNGRRAKCKGGLYAKGRREQSRVRRVTRTRPHGTDISGKQVVFSYNPKFEGECCAESEIGVVRLGGRSLRERRVLAGVQGLSGCEDEPCPFNLNFAPVLDGGFLYWSRSVFAESGGDSINRLRFGERNAAGFRGLTPGRPLPVFTVDHGALFLNDQPGIIRRVDHPAFE